MKKQAIIIINVLIINFMSLVSLAIGFQQELVYLSTGELSAQPNPENDPKEDVIITDIAIASFYNVVKVQESLTGPYLGQKLPGLSPRMFAKGLVSTQEIENNIGFSDNGDMIFVERIINDQSVIKVYKLEDKGWNETLVDNKPRAEIFDQLQNGNMYKFLLDNNIINKQFKLHNNTFIAPDKSYVIFSSKITADSFYKLKISFCDKNGNWTKPKNLSGILKTTKEGNERVCTISPDGKFLFYIVAGDVFWVEKKIIDNIKPTEL